MKGRLKEVFRNFSKPEGSRSKKVPSLFLNKWLLIPVALCSIFAILFGFPSLPERGFFCTSDVIVAGVRSHGDDITVSLTNRCFVSDVGLSHSF